MDLNLVAIAQLNRINQFTFDQEAMDRAVVRQEKRRMFLHALWQGCAQIGTTGKFKRLVAEIATLR